MHENARTIIKLVLFFIVVAFLELFATPEHDRLNIIIGRQQISAF